MPIRITLDIFSGRKNPEIVIAGDQERDLLSRMRKGRELSRRELLPAHRSVLGYRGIMVEQLGRAAMGLPRSFRIANGDLIGEGLRHRVRDEGLEDLICGSTGPFHPLDLSDDVFEVLRRQIERYRRIREHWPHKPKHWPSRHHRRCHCAPLYEPDWWNNDPTRLGCNNCYNYSTNYRTDNFAQPGNASGVSHSTTCPTVTAAAVADG